MEFKLFCKFCDKQCGAITLSDWQIGILTITKELNVEGAKKLHQVHDVRCSECLIKHGAHGRDCDETCPPKDE